MADNEATEDNKVVTESMEETYKKRTGAAGADGHFMEINLLTLCKLHGDQQLRQFNLAGNLESAGDFDDVVFRYTDADDRQNVIFLQSKFRLNANRQITIKTFETEPDWLLQKYFKSFTEIQDEFSKSRSNDPIYGGKTDDLNCDFILYTTANRHDDVKEHVVEVESPFNFVLGESHGQAFKLKADKAKELLQWVQHDVEIELVIKLLKQMQSTNCKNLDRDANFKMYHAFFMQTVLEKNGEHWKYRNEFLEGKFKNEVLKKFRDRTFSWYAEQIMGIPSNDNSSIGNTIRHIGQCQLKLPPWFDYAMPKLQSKLCDEFIKIASQCISDNICTITKMRKNLVKEVSKYVGNVLMYDEDKAMFKFNSENLDDEPRKIQEYLSNQLNSHNTGATLYFDIQIENFPRLSLGFAQIDCKKITDFADRLTILTGQPDVEGLKRLIQTHFGNPSEMEVARYHQIFGKMTEWWKQLGKSTYLRNGDGFMDAILNGILFNVMDPLTSFTGRKQELERLHVALQHKNGGSRTAVISQMASVSGLGGIGKSELARQYVHKYGHNYGSIVWIDAETQDSMGNCFRRLCKDYLKMSTQDANKMEMEMKSIVQQVHSFFKNRKSLFIFDNAQSFKNDGHLADGVKDFLPPTKQGMSIANFLITTRNRKWPNSILIELNVLSDDEAEELVKSSLGLGEDDQQDKDVERLTKQLQNFPLAMQQAVAYIRQKREEFTKSLGVDFTISDYLKLYEFKTKQFLNFKFPDDCDDNYTNTTFMTWNLTLTAIEKSKYGKEARDIFNIMAYLNPNDIPVKFFTEIVNNDLEKLSNVFTLIEKYSMITLCNGVASIHRLVQSVTRLVLQDAGKQNLVLKRALSLVTNHTDNQLIAQGASVWNYANEDCDLVIEFRIIPAQVICALRETLRYEEASAFGKVSLQSLKSKIGNYHEATLSAQFQLTKTQSQQCQYADALSSYKNVFQKMKKTFGPDHDITLDTQYYIAHTLSEQGKYVDAATVYKEVLKRMTETLGPDHAYSLATEHDSIITLIKQGKYDEAQRSFNEVLEKTTKTLGTEHLVSLSTQLNIGTTLFLKGQCADALSCYKEVREKITRIYGTENASSLAAQNNFAISQFQHCQCEDALSSLYEVLEKKKKMFGSHHSSTLGSQLNIATAMMQQGRYEAALKSYKKVLEKTTKCIGPDHILTLKSQNLIAQTLSRQGQYEDALNSFNELLQKMTKILGPDHKDTLDIRHNVANTHSKHGQYKDALSCYKLVLEKRAEIFGLDHPDTLVTLYEIANTLSQQGKYEEAISSFNEVLEKRTNVLGAEHPFSLTTQHNIGQIMCQQGRYADAFCCLNEVLEKRTKVLGVDHPDSLATQHDIAQILLRQGRYADALSSFKEVVVKVIKHFGPDHILTLNTKYYIALTLFNQGQYEDALSSFYEVHEKSAKILGPDHPDTSDAQHWIEITLSKFFANMKIN